MPQDRLFEESNKDVSHLPEAYIGLPIEQMLPAEHANLRRMEDADAHHSEPVTRLSIRAARELVPPKAMILLVMYQAPDRYWSMNELREKVQQHLEGIRNTVPQLALLDLMEEELAGSARGQLTLSRWSRDRLDALETLPTTKDIVALWHETKAAHPSLYP